MLLISEWAASPSSFESIIFEVKYADIHNLHFSLSEEEAWVGNIETTRNTGNLRTFTRAQLPSFPLRKLQSSHHFAVFFLTDTTGLVMSKPTLDRYGVPCASKLLTRTFTLAPTQAYYLPVSKNKWAQTCLTRVCTTKLQWDITLPIHPDPREMIAALTHQSQTATQPRLPVSSCWNGIWSPTHRDVPQMAWVVPTPVQKNYTAIN